MYEMLGEVASIVNTLLSNIVFRCITVNSINICGELYSFAYYNEVDLLVGVGDGLLFLTTCNIVNKYLI